MVVVYLIAVIVCALFYYFTRELNHWKKKNVYGPKPLPVFGNLLQSALRRKHVGIIYQEIYDAYPTEKVIAIFRMVSPSILIRDLDVVKNILIKDFDAFPDRGIAFSKTGLGDNLFHCDSDTWRVMRNKLTPIFTSGKLRNMCQVMSDQGDQFVDYLKKVVLKKPEQETHWHFQKFTMSTIMAASFGLSVDLFNDEKGTVENAGYYSFKSTYAAETDMMFPNILKKMNLSLYKDVVSRFSYQVVKMALEQKNGIPTEKQDAIDTMLTLLKEGDGKVSATKRNENDKDLTMDVTDHLMAGQVFIFFIAGFGNNALTLCYSFFYLAKYPELQEKLLNEINDVLARNDGKLTYDSIKDMPYLDQVFLETLRMHPLTNSVQRASRRSYKIPDSDVVIDKNTSVIISPYAIHRDAKNYPDPGRFDPNRFTAENSSDRHPCAYIPFGAGPRSCIGRQLAKLQYAVGMVKVLTNFKVEPSAKTVEVDNYDPMCTLLATKGGIHLKIIPRN